MSEEVEVEEEGEALYDLPHIVKINVGSPNKKYIINFEGVDSAAGMEKNIRENLTMFYGASGDLSASLNARFTGTPVNVSAEDFLRVIMSLEDASKAADKHTRNRRYFIIFLAIVILTTVTLLIFAYVIGFIFAWILNDKVLRMTKQRMGFMGKIARSAMSWVYVAMYYIQKKKIVNI